MGAAPVQNIGAYGVELADWVDSVEFVELATGKRHRLSAEDCEFGYRDSIFKSAAMGATFIVAVEFKLAKTPDLKLDYGDIKSSVAERGIALNSLTPLQLRDIITQVRQQKLPDPNVHPNVGSFFKNPVVEADHWQRLKQQFPTMVAFPLADGRVKIAAGWLIDQLGWKGKGNEGAGVYERQALVLVNRSKESTHLIRLFQSIQQDVMDRYGIGLEVEPKLVGTVPRP